MRKRRTAGWYWHKLFATPPRKRNMFYQAVQDVCCDSESSSVLGIFTLVNVSYTMEKAQSETGFERDLTKKVVEVECHMTSVGDFLPCVQYSLIKRLA